MNKRTARRLWIVNWVDENGVECQTRFHREYDAILFVESCVAAGLGVQDPYDIDA